MPGVLLFDLDLIRMTFVLGIAVSVLLYERTHTTTGSLVVPGYIGINLLNPFALLSTAVNALVTFFLVSRLLPRFAAVYGRARFVANIGVSVVVNLLAGPVVSSVAGPSIPVLDAIGYVVPALIAYDMNRQGVRKTAEAVTVAGALAALPALLFVLARPGSLEPLLPQSTGLLGLADGWLPIVALVSTGVSATLWASHGLRAGGFVGPMYLGLAATEPLQVGYFIGAALLIWFVVVHMLKRVMILFGRRKFAIMLMGGSLLSWALVQAINAQYPDALPLEHLPIAALFIPALLANDMERTSPRDVCIGAALAAATTLSVVLVLVGLVDGSPVPVWAWPLALVSVGALLFGRITPEPLSGPSRSSAPVVERILQGLRQLGAESPRPA